MTRIGIALSGGGHRATIWGVGVLLYVADAGRQGDVGAIANDLTAVSADPNVSMHEAKAFTVDVRAGRIAAGAPMEPLEPAPWPTREQSPDTPKCDQPEGQAI